MIIVLAVCFALNVLMVFFIPEVNEPLALVSAALCAMGLLMRMK